MFRLIAQEAYRDGQLDPRERQILVTMARFLKLPADVTEAILVAAKANYDAGALGSPRPLDARDLYAHALGYVLADGEVEPEEQAMMEGLRRVLGLGNFSAGTS
jgi:tellurite resistance protein